MEGVIVNFRGGKHTQTNNQMVILAQGIESKDKAKSLIGKTVTWNAPGKKSNKISGKITALHGNKGAVRAHFEKGMPGQSVGKKVTIN